MEAKLPPHDLDAEKSVLSAILIDEDAIIKVMDYLIPESFYKKSHQMIFEGMRALYDQREPIDVVTLTNELKKKKTLTKAGGTAYIAQLSNLVSTAANAVSYAKLVREYYIKRQLISLSGKMSELAFDSGKSAQDVLDVAETKVFKVSQTHSDRDFIPIKDTLVESFERLDELQKNSGELRGLPTGFQDLDRMLAGMQKSNLLILAARPGMGKTALSLNMTQYATVTAKKKVGFFSLEMSKEELVDRLLVSQADIDAWKLKTGQLDQQDFLKLSDAMGVLAEAPLFIDDTPGLNIYEMRTKARRLTAEHQVDLIVVDYLQLAHGRTRDNRVQEVAEISQGLKNIARELRVPVLSLSQLSRAIESRGEKKPQLSDLRESGCLTGETLIYMPDSGQHQTIASLEGQKDFMVLAMNPHTYRLEKKKVTNAFCTGTKPVYELTTQLGRTIRATANHKFFTIDSWLRLDELEVGARVAVPRLLKPEFRSKQVWKKNAKPAMNSQGLTSQAIQKKLKTSYCDSSLYKSNLSRSRAKKVAAIVKSKQLSLLSQSDVYWDKVKTIKAIGKQKVYDLTVPGHENFIANNMIVHNSIEQDADVVMFLYRKDEDIREQVTLKVAKHRNGPLGEVELFFRGNRIKFYGMEKRGES